jgi:hypothetical protein
MVPIGKLTRCGFMMIEWRITLFSQLNLSFLCVLFLTKQNICLKNGDFLFLSEMMLE